MRLPTEILYEIAKSLPNDVNVRLLKSSQKEGDIAFCFVKQSCDNDDFHKICTELNCEGTALNNCEFTCYTQTLSEN